MTGVTADSNIWVSAFHFGGIPRRLVEMGDSGLIRIDISTFIIDEVLRVLRMKFSWPEEALREAESQMNAIGNKGSPKITLEAVTDDPTDDRIVECAKTAGSDFIVTGDRHLLRLAAFEGIRIVRASVFLQIDEGRGRVDRDS